MTYYWPAEREHFGNSVKDLTASGVVRLHTALARTVVVIPTGAGFQVELPHGSVARLGWAFTVFNGGTVDAALVSSPNDFVDPGSVVATIPSGSKVTVYLYDRTDDGDGMWYANLTSGDTVAIR